MCLNPWGKCAKLQFNEKVKVLDIISGLLQCFSGRHPLEGDREVVLDHIVERKRMDDLASSIVDGRFREQKVRVAYQGITASHLRQPCI